MRSPECWWESNMHWKYPGLSLLSLPYPHHLQVLSPLPAEVTCQTDTPGSLGKGTHRGLRSTLWTCFLSAQRLPKQGLERGGKWKWEKGSHDWVEWKACGVGSRKSDMGWGPENPSLGASCYLKSRDWELLRASLVEKEQGRVSGRENMGPQVRSHGPRPGAGVGSLQELAWVLSGPRFLPRVGIHALPAAQAHRWGLWVTLSVEGFCQLGPIKCVK